MLALHERGEEQRIPTGSSVVVVTKSPRILTWRIRSSRTARPLPRYLAQPVA